MDIFFNEYHIYLEIQILLAELVLIYSFPKRKLFYVRLPFTIAACLGLAYAFPMLGEMDIIYNFARVIYMFAISIFGMWFCFERDFLTVFAVCSSGYAVQHIAYHIIGMLTSNEFFANLLYREPMWLFANIPYVLLYIPAFFILGRYAKKNEVFSEPDKSISFISIAIILICIGITRFVSSEEGNMMAVHIYAIVCCVLGLILQFYVSNSLKVKKENTINEMLMFEGRRQLEASRANAEQLGIKIHDMKHILSGLEGNIEKEKLTELKSLITGYDSVFATGNEVLDIILGENEKKCAENGIELTFLGDGRVISFMGKEDVYFFFGNLLENAIEALKKVNEPDRRKIGITLTEKGDMVVLNSVNYYSGEVEMKDGVPLTTKNIEPGYHGFGVKSMKKIAEKYGGRLNITVADGRFTYNVYFLKNSH